MPYVERKDGVIVGVYSGPQVGIPLDFVEDSDIAATVRSFQPGMSVTPRQFRLALNATGMRANIEAYVAAGSQDMKDTWEFATVIERNSAIIAAGAAELGLTEAQIDDLFTLAASL